MSPPWLCLAGELPKRYNANNRPSYGRLINHLYRVWDYDSCVEAQLKIWLARHLLGRNNPGEQDWIVRVARWLAGWVGGRVAG